MKKRAETRKSRKTRSTQPSIDPYHSHQSSEKTRSLGKAKGDRPDVSASKQVSLNEGSSLDVALLFLLYQQLYTHDLTSLLADLLMNEVDEDFFFIRCASEKERNLFVSTGINGK